MNKLDTTKDDKINIYRTNKYIIKQVIAIKSNNVCENRIFSTDFYYKRTQLRDKDFESSFKQRCKLNGQRVHTSSYIRIYCD